MEENDSESLKRGNYEIGYKHPPTHTRFQPGQSGNRKGRPKGAKNFKTDLQEELNERIVVNEGGRIKKLSKQRAFLKTLLAKALKGDARSANTLVGVLTRTTDLSAGDPPATAPLSEQDDELFEALIKRMAGDIQPTSDSEEDS